MNWGDDEKSEESEEKPGEKPSEKPGLAHVGTRARARRKLTDEALERICAHIAGGVPKLHACAREGVSRNALYQLIERDPDVAELVEEAEAAGAEWYRERVMTAEAGNGATDDWKRWAWLAERLHPAAFAAPKTRTEVTGAEGGALAMQWMVPLNPRIPTGEGGQE